MSKATLDWAVSDGKSVLLQTQCVNSELRIKAAIKLIKALPGFNITDSVCCLEHTGIYCAHLLTYLHKLLFPIWLENSLQIKRAEGLQRGKNDTIDAIRIAEYAFRFRDKMQLWKPQRPILQKLAALSVKRPSSAINSIRQQLQQPINEQERFIDPRLQKQLVKSCRIGAPTIFFKVN